MRIARTGYPKIPSTVSAVFLMFGSTVLTVTAILNGSLGIGFALPGIVLIAAAYYK